jgi:hypothetical protein
MQPNDRERFEALLEKLYAGYNMPVSKTRVDAYWQGLAKMPMIQFAKVIDHCLGEGGPERIPNVPSIWAIRNKLSEAAKPAPQHVERENDSLAYFANRLLMHHVIARGGLGSQGTFVAPRGMTECSPLAELEACLKVKQELIDFYHELIEEGSPHANASSFVTDFAKQIAAVSALTPKTLSHFAQYIADPKYKTPFPKTMARKIA